MGRAPWKRVFIARIKVQQHTPPLHVTRILPTQVIYRKLAVLDADVVEHASGPPHGVDGDGGHDRSPNKKQDATGLVGVVLQRMLNTRLVWLIPLSGRWYLRLP